MRNRERTGEPRGASAGTRGSRRTALSTMSLMRAMLSSIAELQTGVTKLRTCGDRLDRVASARLPPKVDLEEGALPLPGATTTAVVGRSRLCQRRGSTALVVDLSVAAAAIVEGAVSSGVQTNTNNLVKNPPINLARSVATPPEAGKAMLPSNIVSSASTFFRKDRAIECPSQRGERPVRPSPRVDPHPQAPEPSLLPMPSPDGSHGWGDPGFVIGSQPCCDGRAARAADRTGWVPLLRPAAPQVRPGGRSRADHVNWNARFERHG